MRYILIGGRARHYGPTTAQVQERVNELIGTEGIEAVAVHLVEPPDAGDVIPGSGGVWKQIAAHLKGAQ